MTNPQRRVDLISKPLGDGLGIFDPRLQKSYLLNATSALVFQHCDGQTTRQQLIRHLRQKFNVSRNQAAQMLGLALDELEKAHLLQGKATTQAVQPVLTRRQALTAFAAAGLSVALLPIVSPLSAAHAAPAAPFSTGTPSPSTTTTPGPTMPPTTTLPPPVKINTQLSQVSFSKVGSTTTPDGSHPAQSTAGVLTARLVLRNNGAAVNNLYYEVRTLNNGNYLLNADGAPGQVGSRLSIANSGLPGVNSQWDGSEQLSQDFRIGVMVAATIQFRVDVYAQSTVVAAGAYGVRQSEWLGSYLFESEPTATEESLNKAFLPLVNR